MLQELCWIHSKLSSEEVMRIVLTRENYEIHVDKTDLVGIFNNCFRIVRKDGRIASINPEQVAMVCTMNKRSVLL